MTVARGIKGIAHVEQGIGNQSALRKNSAFP